jgi:hypothetical protein
MSGASSALGSKPDAQTSMLLLPAGVILLGLTFLPFVYIIPYYVNMILQATIIIFIGAHLSIPGLSLSLCSVQGRARGRRGAAAGRE